MMSASFLTTQETNDNKGEGTMSLLVFDEIIGQALISGEFRDTLLNNRDQALARFNLTPEEYGLIADIEADSVERLAQQLVERLDHKPLNGHKNGHRRNGHNGSMWPFHLE